MTAYEIANPPANAHGARRWAFRAVPTSMGMMGSTQGESVDSSPATKLNPYAVKPIMLS